MQGVIKGISSMATRQVLAELSTAYEEISGRTVVMESVGGVDAARRVQAGEAFDLVILASDAIDKLIAGGSVLAGSRVDLVRSSVGIAVRAGAAKPDVSSEASLRETVLAAATIGYSTGPSGTALLKLFDRWGITETVKDRVVQAPAGVPVASLVARGEVAIGFQQLSELLNVEGIEIAGPMPDPVQIVTVFSGGICARAQHPHEVREMLDFMASPHAAEAKRRQGMEPA